MRGKQPESEPFESPFARTILPQRGRSKVKDTEPGPVETPAAATPAAPPEQPPAAAPAPVPAFAGAAPGAGAAANGYPQIPGFGPTPGAAPVPGFQPPPPAAFAPPAGAQNSAPAAPQGFAPPHMAPQVPLQLPPQGFAPPQVPPQMPAQVPPQGLMPAQVPPQSFAPPQAPYQAPTQGFAPTAPEPGPSSTEGHYHPHHLQPAASMQDAADGPETNGDEQTPPKSRPSKKRLALLAIPLVLALAGVAYLYVPKLLNSSNSSPTPTISFPARLGSFTKATDAATVQKIQAGQHVARSALPALAGLTFAFYGTTPNIVVGAELLPKTVPTKTVAQQDQLIRQVNIKLNNPPDKLAHVAFPTKPGQFWCAFDAARDGNPAGTDCIYVDQHALVLIAIAGSYNAKNIAKAKLLLPLIERS